MFEKEDLLEHFGGYNVMDCVIQNKSCFYFVAGEDYSQRIDEGEVDEEPEDSDKRIIRLTFEDGSDSYKHSDMFGYDWPIYCEMTLPEDRITVIDGDSNVFVGGSGDEGKIATKFQGGFLRGAITRVRNFGGPAICSTNARDLLTRKAPGKWTRIGPEIPSNQGDLKAFADFDAFSMSDIYGVGGEGEVWHFDGRDWAQMDFPTNWGPSAVCCAGDGKVYIGTSGGNVFRGLKDEWELVHEDEMTIPFKDMVWYENKVWCGSDYGIWTIEDGKLNDEPVESTVKICSGHLSVRDGILLTAGFGGAAYLSKGEWKIIFHSHVLRDQG